jgi:hypothetical protein
MTGGGGGGGGRRQQLPLSFACMLKCWRNTYEEAEGSEIERIVVIIAPKLPAVTKAFAVQPKQSAQNSQ